VLSAYTGRFAPTPSGPLHLGSLTAAVISWLDARHHQGRWLLRIDDVDRPRTVPGSADAILRTLDAHGLHWDGPIAWQSARDEAYHEALARLRSERRAFPCACSRKDVLASAQPGWEGPIYPGTCREGLSVGRRGRAWRLRMVQRHWVIEDRALGPVGFDLRLLGGDFVIRRADRVFAYQLATVVDDLDAGVTDVVRGIDLLGSVPRQMQLYQALARTPPRYLHHPVVVAGREGKLAKSSRAAAVDPRDAAGTLVRILRAIGTPGVDALDAPGGSRAVEALLDHAQRHWSPRQLPFEPIPAATLAPEG
jgi:glutamyl-Q tRNA(Asp) synthetase